MKKNTLFLPLLLALLTLPVEAYCDDATAAIGDTLYVVKNDGSIDLFPMAGVKQYVKVAGNLEITAVGETVFTYPLGELESYDHHIQVRRPTLTSFKFNNKFNHQVFTDVECTISDDRRITGQLTSVGHWLTPSFKRSDNRAVVYLDDEQELVSKRSRVKLGSQHRLTVAYPGVNVLKTVMVSPGEEGSTSVVKTPIALTEDMLSTNAPSNYPEREGLAMMLDDDPSTFFHSTWGTGAYEKLPEDEFPYIDVTLPEPVHNLVYELQNRADVGNRSPLVVSLWTSQDGVAWTEAHRFMEMNGFSSAQGAVNTSPVIELDQPTQYFRIMMLQANYKNYFCVSELNFYTASVQSEGGTDAVYEERLVPFGTDYQLELDWKTPVVPRVDVDVEYFEYPDSKIYYLLANVSINGYGFYPSMETTAGQIKGRGNSSWSTNPYSKNPYRLKFDSKIKPFGLKSGKSWVLLSNRQSGSLMTNAIGMYAAGLIGAEGANHIVPVELYLNGQYWGSYNFTEKVGFSNNSIDLPDETNACRLELDTNSDYGETTRYSTPYNLPIKIKEPDFTEVGSTAIESYRDVISRFNSMASLVQRGQDISDEVDVESLAAFLVTNELLLNFEIMHPKSTFLYHENIYADTCKWHWGPVWDLDWSYGYEGSSNYYQTKANNNFWTTYSGSGWTAAPFFKQIRQCGEPIQRAIYKYWTRFMTLHLEELIDYCDEYYAFAKPSFDHNNAQEHGSNRDYTDYATSTENAKRWLRQHALSAYGRLTPFELTEEEIMGITDEEDNVQDDSPFYTDGIEHSTQPTRFDVYDLQGVKLKAGALYNEWRNGLKPGLYIVNGKKVLVTE